MADRHAIIKEVRAAFEHERRINLHRYPIVIDCGDDGAVTLEGEAEDIAAKKLALELAAAVPGVIGIVDRLRVAPAERMGDGAILDAVRDALIEEPALGNCAIKAWRKGRLELEREGYDGPKGVIELSVNAGVVLLDDHVTNLLQKRLAGVLAWWVPGSRDVVNGMAVEPPERDNDDLVTDAVRMVLEKDRLVDAGQVRVQTRNYVVTLDGLVPTEAQRRAAENDAWYVFAVDRVVNRIKALD